MKRLIGITFIAATLFLSCKDDAKKKDTDLINNPRTAAGDYQQDLSKLGTLSFEDTTHDFGKIKDGDVVEYNFAYKNIGKSPIIINTARASCGCTVADYKREPIAVNETGDLKVKFDSKGKEGMVQKTIFVSTNGNPSNYQLTITAEVNK
jgi:Protein of unknown function (DUF1573)